MCNKIPWLSYIHFWIDKTRLFFRGIRNFVDILCPMIEIGVTLIKSFIIDFLLVYSMFVYELLNFVCFYWVTVYSLV